MSKIKHQIVYWFPVYIYMLFILYSSSQSVPLEPKFSKAFLPDYIKHIILFGILSILLYRASSNSNFKSPYLFSILVTIIYGVFDESYQIFVPRRIPSLIDVLSNSLGATLSQFIIFIIKKIKL